MVNGTKGLESLADIITFLKWFGIFFIISLVLSLIVRALWRKGNG